MDCVIMGNNFSLSEPVNLEESKKHCDQVRKQRVGCYEIFIYWDLSLNVLFVLLDIALENTLKDSLLSHVELLLLEFKLFFFILQLTNLFLVKGMLLVNF